MKREDIIAAAEEMIGTPFHAQQSVKGVGTDCIGVLKHIARSNGFKFRDRHAYSMRPTGELQPVLEEYLDRVEGEMMDGDVLLMRWAGMQPHHVAIYAGDGKIIHAYAGARKVTKQDYTDFWKQKTVAVYRFPGIE